MATRATMITVKTSTIETPPFPRLTGVSEWTRASRLGPTHGGPGSDCTSSPCSGLSQSREVCRQSRDRQVVLVDGRARRRGPEELRRLRAHGHRHRELARDLL